MVSVVGAAQRGGDNSGGPGTVDAAQTSRDNSGGLGPAQLAFQQAITEAQTARNASPLKSPQNSSNTAPSKPPLHNGQAPATPDRRLG
jgi:hypothetical protein